MRAPGFWWREPGIAARLLGPPAVLYGALAARRMERPGKRSALPVLCVGNFVVGGTGKTPFAIAVAERLAGLGERPAFLTRGYGGALLGPVIVNPAKHTSRDVGDEALLLARHAETVVARSRPDGARLIEQTGASAIVMDDGLQNPKLSKDFTFAIVDTETGLGNGLCLPAGPLRAPLSDQWKLAQALVLMGPASEAGRLLEQEAKLRGLPVIATSLVAEESVTTRFAGRRVLAFTGIGRPQKFFATLRATGAIVVAERGFPDHHHFSARELDALGAEALQAGAELVTTEKDLVRIGTGSPSVVSGAQLGALAVRARVDSAQGLEALLSVALTRRRGQGPG
jgi:tetraacyldisaccharide 4'-kinase